MKEKVFLSSVFLIVLLGFISCSNGLTSAKKNNSDLVKVTISTKNAGRFATAGKDELDRVYPNLYYYLYGEKVVADGETPESIKDEDLNVQGMSLSDLLDYELYLNQGTWDFILVAKYEFGEGIVDKVIDENVILVSYLTQTITDDNSALFFNMEVNQDANAIGSLDYEVILENDDEFKTNILPEYINVSLKRNGEAVDLEEEGITWDFANSFNSYSLKMDNMPIGWYSLVVSVKTVCYESVYVEQAEDSYINRNNPTYEETVIIDDFIEIKPYVTSTVTGPILSVPLNLRVPLEYNEIVIRGDSMDPLIQTIDLELLGPNNSPRFKTSYLKNEKVILEEPVYSIDHYDFAGWYYLEPNTYDAELENYKPVELIDGQYVINSDYSGTISIVAAKYVPTEYTVTFVSEIGAYEGVALDITYNINDTYAYGLELPELSKQYYEFLGWYNNPDFEGDSWTEITSNDSIQDYTFFAKWHHRVLGLEIWDEDTESILSKDDFDANNTATLNGYNCTYYAKTVIDENDDLDMVDVTAYVSLVDNPEEAYELEREDDFYELFKLSDDVSLKITLEDNNGYYDSAEYIINFHLNEYKITLDSGEAVFNKEYIEEYYSEMFESGKMEISEDARQLIVTVPSGKSFRFDEPLYAFDYPYHKLDSWSGNENLVIRVYDEDVQYEAWFKELVAPAYFAVTIGDGVTISNEEETENAVEELDYGTEVRISIDEAYCEQLGLAPEDYESAEIFYSSQMFERSEDGYHYVLSDYVNKYDPSNPIVLTESNAIYFFARIPDYADSQIYTLVVFINPVDQSGFKPVYDDIEEGDLYLTLVNSVVDEEAETLSLTVKLVVNNEDDYSDGDLDYLWSVNGEYLAEGDSRVTAFDNNTISLLLSDEVINGKVYISCTVRKRVSENRYTVIADPTYVYSLYN